MCCRSKIFAAPEGRPRRLRRARPATGSWPEPVGTARRDPAARPHRVVRGEHQSHSRAAYQRLAHRADARTTSPIASFASGTLARVGACSLQRRPSPPRGCPSCSWLAPPPPPPPPPPPDAPGALCATRAWREAAGAREAYVADGATFCRSPQSQSVTPGSIRDGRAASRTALRASLNESEMLWRQCAVTSDVDRDLYTQ
jgi:hypothetical protein